MKIVSLSARSAQHCDRLAVRVKPLARATLGLMTALMALTPALHAAVSDVIVWDGVRTTSQLKNTLQNGYASTTNMRLWWKLSTPVNLGTDSSGNGRNAKIKGVVQGLSMTDEFGVTRYVATGFNTEDSYIVGDPEFTSASTTDRTYEFWIRNPGRNNSVFFSLTQTETGQIKSGDEDDLLRMWVNADGSISIADRGASTLQTPALAWNTDQWYQMVVVYDYTGNDVHQVKVYRGVRGTPSSLDTALCDYPSSSYGSSPTHWVAIGGHEESYKGALRTGVGMPGFLGCDGPGTAPVITLETYGAVGDGVHDDTYAWRKATSVVSAYGQGTIQLAAGKTYLVGKETIDPSPDTPYYNFARLGRLAGARLGKITVDGSGSTVKLKDGLHAGGYDPVTGAPDSSITSPGVQDPLRLHAAEPGNLLTIETCVDVEVKNLTLDGSIGTQIWGGTYGDKGLQVTQTGIFLQMNDAVWIHDVASGFNTKDGISVYNPVAETDDLKTVLIERATCSSNGRQGLSYNCGNHLEVYDSEFSKTGRVQANKPGCGVDVEPMGRYMAQGVLFDHCRFFDNKSAGLLLLNAPPTIVRDCTLWGTTNVGLWVGIADSKDVDHLFVRCDIYGGYYNQAANRIRFEQCGFHNPDTAYYSADYPNAAVAPRHGIEQVGTSGATILSGCTIDALHAWTSADPKAMSGYCPSGAVLQYCTVTHGNWSAEQAKPAAAGYFANSYFLGTKFRETGIFASNPGTYWVNIGSSANGNLSAIGPGCSIEGPAAGSDHYVLWGTSSGSTPQPAQSPIPVNVSDGVLTPNAGAGETQINTGATYTANPAFTNPADSTGARLFDSDLPNDGWLNTCGLNHVDQTVTVDLKSVRNVRSVRLKMKRDQKPRRIYVDVGDGTTWQRLGLIRPLEGSYTAPWFDVTVPMPVSGRYVKLSFENDGDWGWYLDEVKVYGY